MSDTQAVGQWVLVLFGVGGFAWVVLQIVNSFRRRPPIEAEFATKEEVRRVTDHLTCEFSRLREASSGGVTRGEFEQFRAQVTGQIGEIRGRIDAQTEKISEKIDGLRQDLLADSERKSLRVHERIDELEREAARLDERTRRAGGGAV